MICLPPFLLFKYPNPTCNSANSSICRRVGLAGKNINDFDGLMVVDIQSVFKGIVGQPHQIGPHPYIFDTVRLLNIDPKKSFSWV